MSARRVGPDFHLVELTPEGLELAAGSPVRISNGRISVVFTPGEPVKVARYEWDMLLRDHSHVSGVKLSRIFVETEEPAIAEGNAEVSATPEENEVEPAEAEEKD